LEHFGDATLFQTCWESRTCGVLDAMHWPERLRQTVQMNLLEGLFARMICREAAVVSRMPILGGDYERKRRLKSVCDWNQSIAIRHRERTAGEEVVLNIHKD